MKGTYFQKPFEFNLIVEGESWKQSDPVSGTLVMKNHGTQEEPLSSFQVSLAYGKAPDGFEVLTSVAADGSRKLPAKGEERLSWKFDLDRNCPVTEKSKSLYLLYGKSDSPEKMGQLQLIVHPFWVIQSFLDTLQTQFRFVLKTQKSNKGSVEVKLAPPSSKAFAVIESLVLQMKFEGEQFQVRYLFNVNKIDASAGMTLKKAKQELEQSYRKDEYQTPSGRYNHERMEAAVGEVFKELGLGALL